VVVTEDRILVLVDSNCECVASEGCALEVCGLDPELAGGRGRWHHLAPWLADTQKTRFYLATPHVLRNTGDSFQDLVTSSTLHCDTHVLAGFEQKQP
jgi:hypothetical protein